MTTTQLLELKRKAERGYDLKMDAVTIISLIDEVMTLREALERIEKLYLLRHTDYVPEQLDYHRLAVEALNHGVSK